MINFNHNENRIETQKHMRTNEKKSFSSKSWPFIEPHIHSQHGCQRIQYKLTFPHTAHFSKR